MLLFTREARDLKRFSALQNCAAFRNSGDDASRDFPVNIRQAKIASGVAEGEFLVVEAKQRKNCRVQIVDVNFVARGVETKFV